MPNVGLSLACGFHVGQEKWGCFLWNYYSELVCHSFILPEALYYTQPVIIGEASEGNLFQGCYSLALFGQ